MNAIIVEALRLWGVNPKADIDAILEQARSHGPALGEDELLQLAVHEVRDHRRGQRGE